MDLPWWILPARKNTKGGKITNIKRVKLLRRRIPWKDARCEAKLGKVVFGEYGLQAQYTLDHRQIRSCSYIHVSHYMKRGDKSFGLNLPPGNILLLEYRYCGMGSGKETSGLGRCD